MRRPTRRGVFEAVGLLVALSFVFSVQFIPHLDTFTDPPPDRDPPLVGLARAMAGHGMGVRDGYPYAVHVDEHVHWVWMSKVQRWDRVQTGAPYDPVPPETNLFDSLRGTVHERGFHLVLAQAHELTGISAYHLFYYLPALWMTFIAFAVYAALRPHVAAVPAAAFVALVPTTVRFMGPGFLVPIGFVLAWLPVAAILAEPAKRRAGSAALLFLVVGWAFFVHLIGGFAAVLVLLTGALFGAREGRRAGLTLAVLALFPVLWLYGAFTADVQGEIDREESLPIDLTIFDSFGVYALLLWAIGLCAMALDPPHQHRGTVVALAGLSVAALSLIMAGLVFDLGRYATYARWHPPFFLAASVPAGFGVVAIGRLVRGVLTRGVDRLTALWAPSRRARPVATVLAVLVAVAATGVTANAAVHRHLAEPYYHVMNEEAWSQIIHIDTHYPEENEVFLMHPWRAPYLAAMTGKTPHAVLLPGTPPNNGIDYQNYVAGQAGLDLYILNDITLVIGPTRPPSALFHEVAPGIHVMHEHIASQLRAIRAAELARR